jgi:predicted dehydrogenase
LVAGALSSDPERALASAKELGLDPERSYASFAEMAKAEAARADGIEAVAIVTPNHMHFPAAKAFLEAGIHVICDKPLTSNLADAKKLAAIAEKSGRLFVLTHNYTGYPMVRQAREMVQERRARNNPPGACGIRAGLAHRAAGENRPETGFVAHRSEATGAGGATGDIGTHAYNLGCFVSGLELDSLSADLDAFVDGRACR